MLTFFVLLLPVMQDGEQAGRAVRIDSSLQAAGGVRLTLWRPAVEGSGKLSEALGFEFLDNSEVEDSPRWSLEEAGLSQGTLLCLETFVEGFGFRWLSLEEEDSETLSESEDFGPAGSLEAGTRIRSQLKFHRVDLGLARKGDRGPVEVLGLGGITFFRWTVDSESESGSLELGGGGLGFLGSGRAILPLAGNLYGVLGGTLTVGLLGSDFLTEGEAGLGLRGGACRGEAGYRLMWIWGDDGEKVSRHLNFSGFYLSVGMVF